MWDAFLLSGDIAYLQLYTSLHRPHVYISCTVCTLRGSFGNDLSEVTDTECH